MKKASLLFVIFFFVPICLGMVSVEVAMQNVRQFEADPTLELHYVGLDHELTYIEMGGESPWLPWPCYFIETVLRTRCYEVDPYTGQIILWVDRGARGPVLEYDRQMGNRAISQMITPQQAYNTAVNFILSRNPNFDPNQYKVRVWYSEMTEGGGIIARYKEYKPDLTWSLYQPSLSFLFQKVVLDAEGTEILHLGDTYEIEMDSESGNVYEYVRRAFPLNVTLTPEISRSQAEQIALGVFHSPPYAPYVSYAEVVRVGKALVFVDVPPNCLAYVWVVDVNTYSDDPAYQDDFGAPYDPSGWGVVIDAHTGQVYGVNPYVGAVGEGVSPTKEKVEKFKKACKVEVLPRIVKDGEKLFNTYMLRGKNYITLGQAWVLGVLAEEKGKDVLLKHKGKTLRLSRSDVVRKDGKVYVPLGVVLEIAGYEAKYVPKEKAIYIQKKDNRKEKTHGAIGGG
ncbi:MAG: hypothetical protein ACP5QS_07430, partial [bacterium]